MLTKLFILTVRRIAAALIAHRTGRPLTQAVLTLCVLCVLCGSISAQEWKRAADGVEHAQIRREFGGKAVDINLLRLDLTKVRLDVHHAMDMAIGTEKTSSIATRHGAFAAINAGFFRLDTSIWAGDSSGLLIINREVLSEPANNRTVLAITNSLAETEVGFGRSALRQELMVGGRKIALSGTNRELQQDQIILFTPAFHRTTLTNNATVEVIVRADRISRIVRGAGSTKIPNDGYVLSASGTRVADLGSLRAGMRVTQIVTSVVPKISHEADPADVDTFEDAVAGIPQLIKNGKIDITWEQEKASKSFVETRHPRTAVAKLKDGKFLMLTADGRTDASAGLDLYDLAAYMLELGAVDAMNLDGGGSTTMFLNGRVVNKPSDKEGERKVGDAILVTLRKPARK